MRADCAVFFISERINDLTIKSIYGYTSHHGKARRASPVRRLAKRDGSPSLSKRKYPQARQTKPCMGIAMVDGSYQYGWNAWSEPGISNSRARYRYDTPTGQKSRRGAPSSVESRESYTLFRDYNPRVRGKAFRPELLPHFKTLNSATLSLHTRQTPFTCIWTNSPLRHRNTRSTAIRAAENGGRTWLGMRRPLSQSDVEDLQHCEEMGLLFRRQSRNWGRASGKESGSGKACAFAGANIPAIGSARRTRPHNGFTRSADWAKNWRDFGVTLERCRFPFRRNSRRTGLLSGSDRHAENQRQPQDSSDAGFSRGRAQTSKRETFIRGAVNFSNSQWHPVQRYQPATSELETGRKETRDALAQLAHSASDSRHALATFGSYAQGSASTVGSLENVHNPRNLHNLYSIRTAEGSRKSFGFGDQW